MMYHDCLASNKTNLASKVFVFDPPLTDHSPTMLCMDSAHSHTVFRPLKSALRVDYDAVKSASVKLI